MHKKMALNFTATPAIDFARAMIPRHEAAIAMCRVVLHGSAQAEVDPAVQKMCMHIQTKEHAEIVEMKQWLDKNAPSAENRTCSHFEHYSNYSLPQRCAVTPGAPKQPAGWVHAGSTQPYMGVMAAFL